MKASEPVIVADRLSRRFGDTVAVDELSLEIGAGEIFGFLGHNGAGKTTTVRLLNGVLAPSAGSVRVLGLDPVHQGARVRGRTGVLTETPSLDDRLTGRESLTIYADLYGVPSADVARRVKALLDTFDLGERGDDRIGSYSKGMRQRLALARAILHNPEIVFLDEPTSSLDPVAARHVHQLVEQLSLKGHTVFLCTHNLAEAQSLCDRVAVLEHGRVLALGTPAELGRQLGSRLRLEIEVAANEVDAAASTLQAIPELTGLTRNTHSLIVQGPDREVVPQVVNCLVQAGMHVYRVVPQEPSLEDVYFALHGDKEATV